MNNPDTLATLGTHDTGRKQTNKYTLEKTGVIKNEESKDICNIGGETHEKKIKKHGNLKV
jgi:hypothetical protein